MKLYIRGGGGGGGNGGMVVMICICMGTHIHVHVHGHTHLHTCMGVYTHLHGTHMYMGTHIYIWACTHIYMYMTHTCAFTHLGFLCLISWWWLVWSMRTWGFPSSWTCSTMWSTLTRRATPSSPWSSAFPATAPRMWRESFPVATS